MPDDFGDTILTAGTFSVGGTVFGTIVDEGLTDLDMFQVTLAAGTVYQFDLAGSPTPTSPGAMLNSVLELYDNASNPIATSGLGDDPRMRLTFAPSSTGSYYLLAYAWPGAPFQFPTPSPDPGGTYRLSAVVAPPPAPDDHGDTPATAATGTTSAIRSGTIEASGDSDWFSVALVAGQTYYFDLENGFGNPAAIATLPSFRLHDSTGAALLLGSEDPADHPRFDDGSGGLTTRRSAVITYTAPTSGTYFLSATGTPPSVSATGSLISLGAYTVRVETSGLPIETIGETWLYQHGNTYAREFVSEGADFGDSIALKYQGIDVVAGQFGDFTPIGADANTVVWANAARTQFMIWETDSNGNYITAPLATLPAADPALALLEARFQQDLNRDGVTGIPLDPALAAILSITPLDAHKPEGSTGIQTAFTFTVTRTGNTTSSHAAVLRLAAGVVPGTLPASADDFNSQFDPSFGGTRSLVFQPGDTSKIVTVNVRADSGPEFNESFALTLTAPSINTTIGTASASGIILNDDSVLFIAPLSADKPEGTGGNTAFTFTVSRAGATSLAGSADWSAAGLVGSGTLPADAADFAAGVLPSGTVTFAPGATSQTITVNVLGDVVGEANERFRVTLAHPSAGSVIATTTADAVILNDDTSLGVVATTPTQTEGHAGSRTYSFVVQRKSTINASNDVAWSVAGTGPTPATASDFAGGTFPAGTLNFAPGETAKTVTIAIAGDTTVEPDEHFQLTLSAPSNGGTLHAPSATATILNDDASLSIAPLSASKPEGTGTPTPFTFTATRTGDTTKTHTAKYAVAGTTGNGTQPADAKDFPGGILPAGTITFAPGETAKLLTINVAADAAREVNERFAVTLSAPSSGATLGTARAGAIIFNDDSSLIVAANAPSVIEGQTGTTSYSFTVTRLGATTGSASTSWAVAGSGPSPAGAADFAGGILPSGTVTFAPGEASKTITVAIAGDTLLEDDETFRLTLANPVGTSISTPSATGTIASDDSAISISTTSPQDIETNITHWYPFQLHRAGGASVAQSVQLTLAGSTGPGTSPATAADFGDGFTPITVTFNPGETDKPVYIPLRTDRVAEPDERFVATLSNPSPGAVITQATAEGIILNDDITLAIQPAGIGKYEGNTGITSYVYTVVRTGLISGWSSESWDALRVDWTLTPGGVPATEAVDAADFAGGVLPASGKLTFAKGQTQQNITVNIAGDAIAELDEGFTITLSNAGNLLHFIGALSGPSAGPPPPAPDVTITVYRTLGLVVDDDAIRGTSGDDILVGTPGSDVFLIDGGMDSITGGPGMDAFWFLPAATSNPDTAIFTIEDFSSAAGEKLDLSRVDAIQYNADDAFTFIGTAPFDGTPGQLRYTDTGPTRLIQANTNNDLTADLTIIIKAAGPVTSDWFVL